MQIKVMKSCAEFRTMYGAWINAGNGWFFSDMLFDSADSLKRQYEGMPEYSRENAPEQTEEWKSAEIVVVPVVVAVPDEVKEVQE